MIKTCFRAVRRWDLYCIILCFSIIVQKMWSCRWSSWIYHPFPAVRACFPSVLTRQWQMAYIILKRKDVFTIWTFSTTEATNPQYSYLTPGSIDNAGAVCTLTSKSVLRLCYISFHKPHGQWAAGHRNCATCCSSKVSMRNCSLPVNPLFQKISCFGIMVLQLHVGYETADTEKIWSFESSLLSP